MRILIFSAGFFPGKKCGGPPVSVDNFCTLMNNFDCYIVATDHDMGETQRYENISNGWNDRGNAKVLYLSNKEYASIECLKRIVDEIKPDWMYFQSLFQKCVISGLRIAKKDGINVLLAPRGELCAGAMKKKYKKIPYIYLIRLLGLTKSIHCQSTSEEETDAIKRWLAVPNERIHFLTNIPSLPKHQLNHKGKDIGKANLVFISRIHPKKNLLYAIECLSDVSGEVHFDIYGSIENKEYWEECKKAIELLPDNIHVQYCGLVEHDNVHDVFSNYDAFLFPTLSENYGHVIAEALLSGCPVIISDQTPWTDVNNFRIGKAISLADKKEMSNAVQAIVDMDNDAMNEERIRIRDYLNIKLKIDETTIKYERVFMGE